MTKKISSAIAVLLLATALSGVLSGCISYPGESNATDGSVQPDSSVASASDEQEAIPVSTPGGVMLVGKIEKDNGFYFVPDQPLDIEYTGTGDTVLRFEGLTRLKMLDAGIDGIDKTPYTDRQVTVSGILLTVHENSEELYLHAYSIEEGNTAGKSHAVPDLKPPETGAETTGEPSDLLPEKMMPCIENGHYVYNPYMLPLEAVRAKGGGFADFYIDVIDAVLGYKSTVVCSDSSYAAAISTVLYYEFPLYGVTFECEYAGAGSTEVKFKYLVSREEQEQMFMGLSECINGCLNDVKQEQSEQVKAEVAYHALCTSASYDYAAAESRENIASYYAYVENSGICVTFAAAYSQLLTQIGIENTLVTGNDKKGSVHVWNLVAINGKNYFCDLTYELGWKNGSAFVYFGQTVANRENDGLLSESYMIGKYLITPVEDTDIAESALQIVSIP